ncbi:hypothetical protein [Ottowia sp. SB7-C50]|uniref:hypothetical protein n=1 Tax=Ottowia sp. SB7-C50 TaxID=3081231 RepID=UPI0029533766|nr:hypothetical protein [Ottowia sp. SB7-C50]WOP15764.1 hypothetical protein R0D99_01420 [Ottowia sp. SB7-C50]
MATRFVDKLFTVSKTAGSSATLTEETGTTSDNKIVTVKTVTDDGAGNLGAGLGTVSYASKTASLRVVALDRTTEAYRADHEDAAEFIHTVTDSSGSTGGDKRRGGEYGTASVSEELLAAASLVARYRVGVSVPTNKTMTYTPDRVVIDLCPYTADAIVPGSVQFAWMGQVYQDFEGVIYRGRTATNPGTVSGQLDYANGQAIMTDWVVGGSGPSDFTLQSLYTRKGQWKTASLFFNTIAAPLRPGPGGFALSVVDAAGNVLTASVNSQGAISGDHMTGAVHFATGSVELQFGDFVLDSSLTAAEKTEWWYRAADVGAVQANKIWRPWPVDPTTLRYSIVSFVYLPIDAELLGIDPTALPPDGRVVVFRPGELLVAAKTISGPAFAPSAGQTYNVGTTRLSLVRVLGPDGVAVEDGYSVNLNAGTVTFDNITGWPAQVTVYARQEVYRRIAEVRIDGTVRLTQPLGIELGVADVVSSALRQGDLFSRISRVYDQQTWNGTTWANGLSGDAAVGTYNTAANPIEINNLGGITERWALRFRSDATTFDLIGQHLGQVASGTKNADFSPINPASGAPYFTVRAAGWGNGWVAGNTLFIDTVGASFPVDVIRSVQPSSPGGGNYSFLLEQRGDVDTPPSSPFQ